MYSGNNVQLSEEHEINHGVRQSCALSYTLFNSYVNEIILKWSETYTKGITLSTNTKIKTTLFADYQQIVADSEDSLQRGVLMLTTQQKILEWKYR